MSVRWIPITSGGDAHATGVCWRTVGLTSFHIRAQHNDSLHSNGLLVQLRLLSGKSKRSGMAINALPLMFRLFKDTKCDISGRYLMRDCISSRVYRRETFLKVDAGITENLLKWSCALSSAGAAERLGNTCKLQRGAKSCFKFGRCFRIRLPFKSLLSFMENTVRSWKFASCKLFIYIAPLVSSCLIRPEAPPKCIGSTGNLWPPM